MQLSRLCSLKYFIPFNVSTSCVYIRFQSNSNLQCVRDCVLAIGGKVFDRMHPKCAWDLVCHIVGDKVSNLISFYPYICRD